MACPACGSSAWPRTIPPTMAGAQWEAVGWGFYPQRGLRGTGLPQPGRLGARLGA